MVASQVQLGDRGERGRWDLCADRSGIRRAETRLVPSHLLCSAETRTTVPSPQTTTTSGEAAGHGPLSGAPMFNPVNRECLRCGR